MEIPPQLVKLPPRYMSHQRMNEIDLSFPASHMGVLREARLQRQFSQRDKQDSAFGLECWEVAQAFMNPVTCVAPEDLKARLR